MAIVVYAGVSGLVLASTPVSKKDVIVKMIDGLTPGGTTAGASGITLAYQTADENYDPKCNNRIILVTDGDFNVGVTSDAELVDLVAAKKGIGVYLTILGFGIGNYQDNKMEEISNAANGNYFYINNEEEAQKFLSKGFKSMLYVAQKDVKFQVEFNPAKVLEYRLIGYENRKLEDQDFADVTKDAGDLGLDHSVTAVYEVKPNLQGQTVDPGLRYQNSQLTDSSLFSEELAFVKVSYLNPGDDSVSIEYLAIGSTIKAWSQATEDYRLAACVAMYGMVLNNSKFLSKGSLELALAEMQKLTKNRDRESFIQLIIDTIKARDAQKK